MTCARPVTPAGGSSCARGRCLIRQRRRIIEHRRMRGPFVALARPPRFTSSQWRWPFHTFCLQSRPRTGMMVSHSGSTLPNDSAGATNYLRWLAVPSPSAHPVLSSAYHTVSSRPPSDYLQHSRANYCMAYCSTDLLLLLLLPLLPPLLLLLLLPPPSSLYF